MKKSLILGAFALFMAGTFVTSCSDDDTPKVVCPIEKTTFNDAKGLKMTYSGQPMLGKQVEFTPSETDATKGVITLSGAPLIMSAGRENVSDVPVMSGVIPGEKTTTINVDLKIENDVVTFEGEDLNEAGRKVAYKGKVTKDEMNLDLSVTMPKNNFAGSKWKILSKPQSEGDFPFVVQWKHGVEKIEIDEFIKLLFATIPVEDTLLLEYIPQVFGEISFLEDGNIQAQYKKSKNDKEWIDSPMNIATYSVTSEGNIVLYINAAQIIAGVEGNNSNIIQTVFGIVPSLKSLLSDGVTLTVRKNENGSTSVFMDENVLLPILKDVKPLFENEDIKAGIIEFVKKNAGPLADFAVYLVTPILDAMPNIIDTTSDMEIGINIAPVVAE